MTPSRLALVVAVLLLALSACKSNCRTLAERLCDCTANSVDRDSCLRRAAANESNNPPTVEDEDTCRPLLEQCDCRLIDTPEGKVRCGLARP